MSRQLLLLRETLREQVGEPAQRTGFSATSVVRCPLPVRKILIHPSSDTRSLLPLLYETLRER